MNVYDFDKTIFHKDTTFQFYLWSIRRWPKMLRFLPGTLISAFSMKLGLCDKNVFKQSLFRFLRDVPEPKKQIERFWNEHMNLIHRWYLDAHRPDDVVITASPVDFVRPACRRLGIEYVLGSPVDIEKGVCTGKNCDGAEKVRAFDAAFPGARVERFYSDSLHDTPMAMRAETAYMVKGERLEPWPGKGTRT